MYYLYKVTYWSIEEGEEKTDKGIVYAKSYGKASMKVLEDYDASAVVDIYLQELDCGNTINEDEIKKALM